MTTTLCAAMLVTSIASMCSPMKAGGPASGAGRRAFCGSISTKGSHGLLIADSRRQQKTTTTLAHQRRLLWDGAVQNPVPLLGAAALLAAVGPPAFQSLKSLPRAMSRLSLKRTRRSMPRGPSSAMRPDGTLEDGQLSEEAQGLLRAWRAGEDRSADDRLREAALGLAILGFVQSGADDASALLELTSLAARAGGGEGLGVGALRKASTAAARALVGAGRDGSALDAHRKEECCGALLMLTEVLLGAAPSSSSPSAGSTEAAALVRTHVQLAFSIESQDATAVQLRRKAAQGLLRRSARGALRTSSSDPESAAAALEAAVSPLIPLVGLEGTHVAPVLLTEAREMLTTELEAALELWVAGGGASAPEPSESPLFLLEAQDRAARAAKLAIACLKISIKAAEGVAPPTELEAELQWREMMRLHLRALGLTSRTRHAFYAAFVRVGALNDATAAAAGCVSTMSPQSGGGFGAEEAVVLRRLLSVLPVSATAAELAAFQACAKTPGAPRASLVMIAERLGVERARALEILDDGWLVDPTPP
jgi:hypothetical protein